MVGKAELECQRGRHLEVAIQKLAHEAGRLGVSLNLFAMDVTEFHFKPAQFDLIVMFYHFDRNVCPNVYPR